MSCDSPPPPTCSSSNTLRSYSASGTCSAGTCSYPHSDVTCVAGCQAGACAPSCGGAVCRAGQTCVGDSCAYSTCVGANVPGDYATVQAAVNALAPAGGTICLGAQAFSEDVSVSTSVASSPSGDLIIQGVSSTTTTVRSFTIGAGNVSLRGIGMQSATVMNGTVNSVPNEGFPSVAISNCSIAQTSAATTSTALSLEGFEFSVTASDSQITSMAGPAISATATGSLTLVLSRDDISAPQTAAIGYATNGGGGRQQLSVDDCYVHDSQAGINYLDDPNCSPALTFENNTFTGDGDAIALDLPGASGSLAHAPGSVAYFNNLFLDDGTAVNLSVTDAATLTSSANNNLYFGNTSNFSGAARAGSADVFSDPQLDETVSPPTPGATSSARGAGDAQHAQATDYWGTARGASVDIGAVQSP